MFKKILFVCTGNTCRSPMAEGLLKKLASENQIFLEVQSAGLGAFAGVPAAPEAIEACKEIGIDISNHQSQPLSKTLVMDSDLILTMTRKHKEMIVKKIPDIESKLFVLSEFAEHLVEDIEDPVGKPLQSYKKTLSQIQGYLQKALLRFKV